VKYLFLGGYGPIFRTTIGKYLQGCVYLFYN
jgi:hypothetical protein